MYPAKQRSAFPSRMEIAGWALAGLIPQALAFGPHERDSIAVLSISLSMGVCCGRVSKCWKRGMIAAGILFLIHYTLIFENLYWLIFYWDPREGYPATELFFPLRSNPGTSQLSVIRLQANESILMTTTAWMMLMAITCSCVMGRTSFMYVGKALLRICLSTIPLLVFHLTFCPQFSRIHGIQGNWSLMRICITFWTLLAIWSSYFLATFWDFPRNDSSVTRV